MAESSLKTLRRHWPDRIVCILRGHIWLYHRGMNGPLLERCSRCKATRHA